MGNRIRELRKAKAMTMKELGRLIGVAESTISQYETGKRQPDNEALLKFGEIFDVSVGYILGSETEKAPAKSGERSVDFDDFTYAMYEESRELTEENKQKLLEMAQFFRQQQEKHKG